MKLYDYKPAPNPRRVRIFAAEKRIDLDLVPVDLRADAQFDDGFRAVNPRLTVPVLELDDGTRIMESVAICRYLEETQPEPPLMGVDPSGKAMVEMWHRRMELEGMQAAAEVLRNTANKFKDHALAGSVAYAQIPELAERGRQRIRHFFDMLDERLSESEYVAGPRYTIADIAALVTVDFAGWVKEKPADSATALNAWHERVSARPSAAA